MTQTVLLVDWRTNGSENNSGLSLVAFNKVFSLSANKKVSVVFAEQRISGLKRTACHWVFEFCSLPSKNPIKHVTHRKRDCFARPGELLRCDSMEFDLCVESHNISMSALVGWHASYKSLETVDVKDKPRSGWLHVTDKQDENLLVEEPRPHPFHCCKALRERLPSNLLLNVHAQTRMVHSTISHGFDAQWENFTWTKRELVFLHLCWLIHSYASGGLEFSTSLLHIEEHDCNGHGNIANGVL